LVSCQNISDNSFFSAEKLNHIASHFGIQDDLVNQTKQIIWVESKQWNNIKAKAYLLEIKNNRWHIIKSFPVVLGRNGMRWGQGLHQKNIGIEKQEGDGCSPAGIFALSDGFGTAFSAGNWPYKTLTDEDLFIDDSQSTYYNQWVKKDRVTKDWSSFEVMQRPDGLYNRGFIIQHNMNPVIAGKGSAIFFHIWRDKQSPTAGCTATTKENMDYILNWMDTNKNPILIQLPTSYLNKV